MKIFIVVEGGIVQYVSSDAEQDIDVHVLDRDDIYDDPAEGGQELLDEADDLARIW